MRRSEPKQRPNPRPIRSKRLKFCAVVSSAWIAGCAAPVRVVSECPEPSPIEAQDVSEWLIEGPPRPAQDWAARVIGQLYHEDLEQERGLDASHPWWWLGPDRE